MSVIGVEADGMARNIFHIDFNCFYCSVEMQRHPEIRNKPVAICGSQQDRHGIVLTANYVAKPFGVKTGMPIWKARKCCPDLVVLPPDMREYIRISRLARKIYEDYTDQIEPFGLDENWLDVTGSVGLFGSPMSNIVLIIADNGIKFLADVGSGGDNRPLFPIGGILFFFSR